MLAGCAPVAVFVVCNCCGTLPGPSGVATLCSPQSLNASGAFVRDWWGAGTVSAFALISAPATTNKKQQKEITIAWRPPCCHRRACGLWAASRMSLHSAAKAQDTIFPKRAPTIRVSSRKQKNTNRVSKRCREGPWAQKRHGQGSPRHVGPIPETMVFCTPGTLYSQSGPQQQYV